MNRHNLGNIRQHLVCGFMEEEGNNSCHLPGKHGFYCMFANETQILRRLAILAVCHSLAAGQIISQYFLVQTPMPWCKAREFCQRHYVDLAVLNSEEQYFTLVNATPTNKVSYWLGLKRQGVFSSWMWVSGEELAYEHWHLKNYRGRCASLEAMLEKDGKLLARYCDESHMTVCQGPVSPQSVTVDSVGDDHVNISWTISSFMLMTPHSYNVTICAQKCKTFFYSHANGSSAVNVSISNLTSVTQYFVEISAFVVRPNSLTGRKAILQNDPATLQIKTEDTKLNKIVVVIFKILRFVPLAAPLWILYNTLKKDGFIDKSHGVSFVELSAEDTTVNWTHQRNRPFG